MSKKWKNTLPKQSIELVRSNRGMNGWVRCTLMAELLSDGHLGSGLGGDSTALIARDRFGKPVIWASHIEGVLRDAARRLHDDKAAEDFFGRAGGDYTRGDQQRAIFTSLYTQDNHESHIWRSTARMAFDNRAPKDDTLRTIEYVSNGTKFIGEVELPANEMPILRRLVQEVDALGSGRSTGAGQVKLSLSDVQTVPCDVGTPTSRLLILLKNCDPLCITATATPDNLIPSFAFVPGRALLGAIAAWLISEGDRETASLLTSGRVSVSDALPLPQPPMNLATTEVLPAPLSLQSTKPKGALGDVPWWAQVKTVTPRFDALRGQDKLKRPEDDLFVYRADNTKAWKTFRPANRVRLRNGRPDSKQADVSLFAIEQIAEKTHFFAEIQGPIQDMKRLSDILSPVLKGWRWLRVGRAGAPVEVVQRMWLDDVSQVKTADTMLLTLTSDLLVRDRELRWRTVLDGEAMRDLLGIEDVTIVETERGHKKTLQDSVMIHGFNGTSRLWRMPVAAIRRGSVFEIKGSGVAKLAQWAANGQWLGERTHEGFGRFRLDTELPGVNGETSVSTQCIPIPDNDEETIANDTKMWFDKHRALGKAANNGGKPSLSQWFDLIDDLERNDVNAMDSRLRPTTAGAKNWRNKDAEAILRKLNELKAPQRLRYARMFVRWLRAHLRLEAT